MGEIHGVVASSASGLSNSTSVASFPLAAIVQTVDCRVVPGISAYGVANHAKGVRVIIPKTGTLKGFTIWVGTASGNCEGFILDTTATTRNVLWASGSVVVTGASSLQTLGDPNISVTAGQHIDLALTIDNITATVARAATITNLHTMPAGFPVQAPGGGKNQFVWDIAQTIPIGSTVTEASFAGTSICPHITAYVT